MVNKWNPFSSSLRYGSPSLVRSLRSFCQTSQSSASQTAPVLKSTTTCTSKVRCESMASRSSSRFLRWCWNASSLVQLIYTRFPPPSTSLWFSATQPFKGNLWEQTCLFLKRDWSQNEMIMRLFTAKSFSCVNIIPKQTHAISVKPFCSWNQIKSSLTSVMFCFFFKLNQDWTPFCDLFIPQHGVWFIRGWWLIFYSSSSDRV